MSNQKPDAYIEAIARLLRAYFDCIAFKATYAGHWDTHDEWERAFAKAKTAARRMRKTAEDATVRLIAAAYDVGRDVPTRWRPLVCIALQEGASIESGRDVMVGDLDEGTLKLLVCAIVELRHEHLDMRGAIMARVETEGDSPATEGDLQGSKKKRLSPDEANDILIEKIAADPSLALESGQVMAGAVGCAIGTLRKTVMYIQLRDKYGKRRQAAPPLVDLNVKAGGEFVDRFDEATGELDPVLEKAKDGQEMELERLMRQQAVDDDAKGKWTRRSKRRV